MLTSKNSIHDELESTKERASSDALRRHLLWLIIPVLLIAGLYLGYRAEPKNEAKEQLNYALRLWKKGNYEQALPALLKAVELWQTNASVCARLWNCIGIIYHKAGQYAAADQAYRSAISLDDMLIEAHYNRGLLHMELGLNHEAVKELFVYVTYRPTDPVALNRLGTCLYNLVRIEEATEIFARAIKFAKEPAQLAEALNGLGVCLALKGEYEGARKMLEYALKQRPRYGAALWNKAVVELRLADDRIRAIQSLQSFIDVTPSNTDKQIASKWLEELATDLKPSLQVSSDHSPPAILLSNIFKVAQYAPPIKEDQILTNVKVPTIPPVQLSADQIDIHPPQTSQQFHQVQQQLLPPDGPPDLLTNQVSQEQETKQESNLVVKVTDHDKTPQTFFSIDETNQIAQALEHPIYGFQETLNQIVASNLFQQQSQQTTNESTDKVVLSGQLSHTSVPVEPHSVEVTSEERLASNVMREQYLISQPPTIREPQRSERPRSWFERINPLRLFSSSDTKSSTHSMVKVTPLSSSSKEGMIGAKEKVNLEARSDKMPRQWPRYKYTTPSLPMAGDRGKAWPYFEQALRFHQQGRLSEAIDFYQRALTVDPAFFEARYNLALALYQNGNLGSALVEYEKALILQPGHPDARYNFALALDQAGFPLDAVAELEKLIELDRSYVNAYLLLGNLYAQKLANIQKAGEYYRRVLELDPNNPQGMIIREWISYHKMAGLLK